MTFIDNIFKLYYHELKVNKKIIVLFSLFNSYRGHYSAGDIDLIKDLSPKILESASNSQEKAFFKEVLTGAIGFKSAMTGNILMLAPICLASILASYILVTRDFRKKNTSFYLIYSLPNRIIEIKLAKILAGLSLYIYTIILITLGLVCIDYMNLLKFARNMTKEVLFLPFDFRSSIFYTFMLVLPSIIGLQSSASIIHAGDSNTRLPKRIGFFILIMFAAVLVLFIGIDVNTYGIFVGIGQNYLTSIPTFIFLVFLYILVAILFIMDMVYSKKSFRGGLGYEDK